MESLDSSASQGVPTKNQGAPVEKSSAAPAPPESASQPWRPLRDRVSFVLLYLAAIVPTYVLPYFGSNSGFLNTVGVGLGAGILPQFWMHATALLGAIVIAWYRGLYVGMPWLPLFPFLASIFDLTPGLNWLFLVPTSFHIAALIAGSIREPRAARLPSLALRLGIAVLAASSLNAAYRFATYTISSPSLTGPAVSAPTTAAPTTSPSVGANPTAAADLPTPQVRSTRWRVAQLPMLRGVNDPMPRISTLTLLDTNGRPVPYRVQYVPGGFLSYVADHLRARRAMSLSSAPEGFPGSEVKVAVDAGSTVRVLEIFTDVVTPTVLRAEQQLKMIRPGSGTQSNPQGDLYPISQGTLVVLIHETASECPTLFLSTQEVVDVCWPDSDVPWKRVGPELVLRSAFLVELEGGRRAWTSYVDETGAAETWLTADWIPCQSITAGSDQRITCSE